MLHEQTRLIEEAKVGLKRFGAASERSNTAGMRAGIRMVGKGAAELLWPTRCVLCDVPGALLCDACCLELPYIDLLDACPTCGQPYGKFACVNCNSFVVEHRGLAPDQQGERQGKEGVSQGKTGKTQDDPLDFEEQRGFHSLDQSVSVFQFVDPCRKLITVYKDRKEIRLAAVLASLLNEYINPSWIKRGHTALVVIPARRQALRERGFDHMKKIGEALACLSGLPLLEVLATSERSDQRGLSALSRQTNMRGSFIPKPLEHHQHIAEVVVLVDDVFTTGATLTSAAATLKAMGVKRVYGLTVARVP